MICSNRNLLFQGSIFRFQPFVLGGVLTYFHQMIGQISSMIPGSRETTSTTFNNKLSWSLVVGKKPPRQIISSFFDKKCNTWKTAIAVNLTLNFTLKNQPQLPKKNGTFLCFPGNGLLNLWSPLDSGNHAGKQPFSESKGEYILGIAPSH